MHPAFKTYDIRGRIGVDIDEAFAEALGHATVSVTGAATVVVGGDARETSPAFKAALAKGLADAGAKVFDIGFCGTEEIYFATEHLSCDAGIMVTASHNPINYNGMKLVGRGSAPLADHTFKAIGEAIGVRVEASKGTIEMADTRAAYVVRALSFAEGVKPLHIVANAGNGAAGPTFDAILEAMGEAVKVTRVHHEPDATFPNGIPNPLLPENHAATADVVRAEGADLGIAWDGDFDRCFFFDAEGEFVAGEYVVGLLAQATLALQPGAKIVHDPRVQWNTQALVAEAGGEAVVSRTGHALIKAKMREVDAAYGGEMSAHHYFRDFMYCDSGMIPWLLVVSWMSRTGKSLKDLIEGMRAAFPSSGEMNFRVEDATATMAAIEAKYSPGGEVDHLDGLSVAYSDWRFNLRKSNTEPLLRLNVETRADTDLLAEKVAELRAMIEG
ncbi:MAG: phosphomannomutase/phosphoglucomutase [Rhodobacteraceae bacterium]|nr:phosphomannomutase/phosphoglucomutase [Paracoccaceae bacterium]